DRLDGTLRFAGAAIFGQHSACECERVLAGNDRAECVLLVRVVPFDVHHAPICLARREVEPTDRTTASAEIRLAIAFLTRPDGDVARKRSDAVEPCKRFMVGRTQAPGARPDRITVSGEPAVHEASDVLGIRVLWERSLQVRGRAHDPGAY